MTFAFIFDLDGTLVDSAAQITLCANQVRIERNNAPLSDQRSLELIGLPAKELFADVARDSSELSELVSSFRYRLGNEIQKGNLVFAGVSEFLSKAGASSIPRAVATSKPQYLAESVISKSKISSQIDFTQGTDGFDPKPNPEVLFRALKGVGGEFGAMFGDRPEDMIAAKAAGLVGVGIKQSCFGHDELMDAGATFTYDNFHQALLDFDSLVWHITSQAPRK